MKLSQYQSPLGTLNFWFLQGSLIYASFSKESGTKWLRRHFPQAKARETELTPAYTEDLNHYFQGRKIAWAWPIKLIGTPFQQAVWREIQKIPQGQFTTYKHIGEALNTKAFQAVGQAVGANPISIIVPCHRVLGTNWFGGYGGGLNRKRLLLELEGAQLPPKVNA